MCRGAAAVRCSVVAAVGLHVSGMSDPGDNSTVFGRNRFPSRSPARWWSGRDRGTGRDSLTASEVRSLRGPLRSAWGGTPTVTVLPAVGCLRSPLSSSGPSVTSLTVSNGANPRARVRIPSGTPPTVLTIAPASSHPIRPRPTKSTTSLRGRGVNTTRPSRNPFKSCRLSETWRPMSPRQSASTVRTRRSIVRRSMGSASWSRWSLASSARSVACWRSLARNASSTEARSGAWPTAAV
jgi:hypothetical protein